MVVIRVVISLVLFESCPPVVHLAAAAVHGRAASRVGQRNLTPRGVGQRTTIRQTTWLRGQREKRGVDAFHLF